ncbi:hypothetical protein EDC45_1384 [Mesocricetibacter intestinalis]|uniref:Permease n=1 Tax=Mesocricetibacter intestinalis TaxID=1521930 RepID=A0A4R6VBL8_9PAST|nr:AEC family transporter [Mesocricetibacter intestinalis]TDQ57330.1 hypothetical protein EDC45_1384 [Mesocricetibacter intestinalis]
MHGASFFSSFLFSMGVTLPNLLILMLGIILRRIGMIDDRFCEQATKLVFNITLPLLLFLSIVNNHVDYASQALLLGVGICGTLIMFVLAECFAAKFIAEKTERGTFVQSVYRGNNGIIGLALCINAYGDAVFAPASIYAAGLTLIYNILGVITLSRSLSDGKVSMGAMLKNIAKNPLIIAIILGLVANALQLRLVKPLQLTGGYLAAVTLPLALICAGASINFRAIGQLSGVSLRSSIGRVLFAPVFMVLIAKGFGLKGMDMGIVLLMATTPLAAAAYAMVRAMGGNAVTVANIIGITTIGSMLASALGLILLSQIGWL